MYTLRRRGLSPIIATVLLIAIALILAVIIFLWAKHFIAESVDKNGQSVELVCEHVSFLSEAYGGQLIVENIGEIPIYAVEMRVVGNGEISEIGKTPDGNTIGAGQTANFSLDPEINEGDKVLVIPILLGETSEELQPYVCDEDYGVEIEVTS
jgi:flagellin-like protein